MTEESKLNYRSVYLWISPKKETNFAGSLKNKDSGWCESQSIFSSIPSLHISIEHFYTAVSHYLTSILHRFFWAGTINTLPFKCLGLVWFFVMFFCSFIVEDCIYLIKNTVKKLYCEIILQFETTVLLELSMLKTVVLLNICVEIMIHFWRILWRLESSKEQHLLEIEIFLFFFLLSTIFIFYFFTHNITEYPK